MKVDIEGYKRCLKAYAFHGLDDAIGSLKFALFVKI